MKHFKETDLMVGDWVMWKNDHPIKIEEILVNDDGYAINGIWDYHELRSWINIDDIKSIPLTAEILEKNGFKLNPQGAYSNGRHTSIGVVRDGRYFANINTETDDPSFLYQCGKYVHEFQHALRLCGLDELADNFKVEE